MRNYGQFCPIARGSEILAERWTPIILRNLLLGCRTFNEIAAGAPGLSRALLARLEGPSGDTALGLLADVTDHPYRLHLEQHRLTVDRDIPVDLGTLSERVDRCGERVHGGRVRRVDHRLAGDIGGRLGAPVEAFAAGKLAPLVGLDRVDGLNGNVELTDRVLVQDPQSAGCDGAHRQLLVPGHADLADHQHVERRPEGVGDLGRHRHTTPRQPEDHGVVGGEVGEVVESLRPGDGGDPPRILVVPVYGQQLAPTHHPVTAIDPAPLYAPAVAYQTSARFL
jgi:hypothetical protein